MKKLIFLLFFGILFSAKAEVNIIDTLKKFPAVNQAVIYSFDDSKINYASTITVVSLFDRINLDVGWTPRQEIIGTAGVKLFSGKHLDFPVLKYVTIEPFAYIGSDRLDFGGEKARRSNWEFDKGVGVKLLAVHF